MPFVDKLCRMHFEQNVCEQLVIIGVSKISLHTWQRRFVSKSERAGMVVVEKSEGSEMVRESMTVEISEEDTGALRGPH
jgi:hypothetical protein